MSSHEERNRFDGLAEECECLPASHIAGLVLEGRSSENMCLLCLCGESLLGVEDSVYLGNEHIDTTIPLKMLLDKLRIIPTEYANGTGVLKKVCATCVNQLSEFYLFIFKCQKSLHAYKEIKLILCDTEASQNKLLSSIEIPSDNIYDYASDYKFVGLQHATHNEDIEFGIKTEPLDMISMAHPIQKIENGSLHNDVQATTTIGQHQSCSICDVNFETANRLARHKRHHQYSNVINHISQCTPLCICCLKTGQNMIFLSDKIYVNEMSNEHGGLSKCEETPVILINKVFNITIGEISGSVMICDICIGQLMKAFQLYNTLNESLTCFKSVVKIFEESLNKIIYDSNEVNSSQGKIYIDFNKLSHSKVNNCKGYKKRKNRKSKNSKKSLFVCDHCSMRFIYKDGIRRHLRINHINVLNIQHEEVCTICTKAFMTKSDLQAHTKIHLDDYITCEYCKDIVQRQYDARHGAMCVKKKKPHNCDLCDATFVTKQQTYDHRKKHFPKKKCPLCDKRFKVESFKRHISKHVAKKQLNIQELEAFGINLPKKQHKKTSIIEKCPICHKVSANSSHLLTHTSKELEEFKIKINKADKIVCNHCGKVLSKLHMQRHIKEAHYSTKVPMQRKEKRRATAKRYQCDKCDFKISNWSALEGHINKEHLNRQPYSCDICSKRFYYKYVCTQHIQRKHGRSEACPHCGKYFGSKQGLLRHMGRHDGEKKAYVYALKCDLCDYKTSAKAALEGHMNKHHLNRRPYSCDICSKGFLTKYACAEHKLIHAQIKSEVCPHCGNRFGSRKALTSHIRLHTGERPYKCSECDNGFVNANRLQHHLQTKHSAKDTPCPFCSKLFHRVQLRGHIRSTHEKTGNVIKTKRGMHKSKTSL